VEKSITGHMHVIGFYLKLGKRNIKGSMMEPGGIWKQRGCASLLRLLLKLILTYGKGGKG
jgi:hypothetical protein